MPSTVLQTDIRVCFVQQSNNIRTDLSRAGRPALRAGAQVRQVNLEAHSESGSYHLIRVLQRGHKQVLDDKFCPWKKFPFSVVLNHNLTTTKKR